MHFTPNTSGCYGLRFLALLHEKSLLGTYFRTALLGCCGSDIWTYLTSLEMGFIRIQIWESKRGCAYFG